MRSFLFSALILAAGTAYADDTDTGETQQKPHDAAEAADAGNFLPLSVSPKTPSSHAQMLGGYDSARGGALVSTEIEARLHERFQIAFSGTYEGPGSSFAPKVVGQLSILDEHEHGLDLSVFGGWEKEGFNQVPDVLGRVALGRHVGGAYVVGSTAMGFGTQDGERYGELTLAGIGRIAPHLHGGLDLRGRMDLQHDTDPSSEEQWEVEVGPVASYTVGPVAVTAMAGASALQMHRAPSTNTGALGMLGVGAVF